MSMQDRLPWKELFERLLDLFFYLLIFIFWLQLIFLESFVELKLVGVFTILISSFLVYRQANFYNLQSNPIENTYISGGFTNTPVYPIAVLRYKLSKFNYLFGFCGAVASSWSFITNT
jgi:hypothetical protein